MAPPNDNSCSIDQYHSGIVPPNNSLKKQTTLNLATLSGAEARKAIPDKQFRLCNYKEGDVISVFIGGLLETNTIWNEYRKKFDENKLPYVLLALPGQDGREGAEKEFTASNIIKKLTSVMNEISNTVKSNNPKLHIVGQSLGAPASIILAEALDKSEANPKVLKLTLLAPAFETHETIRIQGPKTVFSTVGKTACQNYASAGSLIFGDVSIKRFRDITKFESNEAKQELIFQKDLPSQKICEAIDLSLQSKVKLPAVASQTTMIFGNKDQLVKVPDSLPGNPTMKVIDGAHLMPLNPEGRQIGKEILEYAIAARTAQNLKPNSR